MSSSSSSSSSSRSAPDDKGADEKDNNIEAKSTAPAPVEPPARVTLPSGDVVAPIELPPEPESSIVFPGPHPHPPTGDKKSSEGKEAKRGIKRDRSTAYGEEEGKTIAPPVATAPPIVPPSPAPGSRRRFTDAGLWQSYARDAQEHQAKAAASSSSSSSSSSHAGALSSDVASARGEGAEGKEPTTKIPRK